MIGAATERDLPEVRALLERQHLPLASVDMHLATLEKARVDRLLAQAKFLREARRFAPASQPFESANPRSTIRSVQRDFNSGRKPMKTRPMSSGLPRSATASAIELLYFNATNGVSFSWSSSCRPTRT